MSPEQTDGQAPGLDPNDTTRPPDGAPPAPAPAAASEGQPPAAPIDPDAAEMAAAKAALAAEEAAKAGGGQQPGQPPAAATGQDALQDSIPAATAPTTEGAKPPAMVPHAVFHTERRGRQQAERERDYLAGKVEALEAIATKGTAPAAATPATGSPAASPPPAANPVQAEIDARQAEIFAAADQFDTGEITMAEFKRVEAAAQARINDLRTQQVVAASMTQQGPSLADTAIVTAHLTTLAQEFPHSQLLTPEQAQWLANRELDKARAFGRPYGTDRKADLDLQAAVAAQAEEFFRDAGIAVPAEVTAAATAAKQRRSGGAQQPKPGQQPPLSPEAQARLRKMDFAAGLPPDTAQMGAAGSSLDLSDASIATMSDEQIAALPAAARARIFSLTG